ncbi:MAG: iron ABC transporter permease [Fervidobacterium sp.]|uniref:Iron(III) transport system permease protein n=1 Tax=Fervidobacterium gondwanense DSM 13020 TaxID=1121883 RepID=A0A1M7SZ78_FERGO|nr:iron ABC transporter permease [Fervidobacterium gondwanense]UXF01070.1 ABC transporter permease [Fervidobacterium riparium]SHN63803.1 iron(III) transport system permease protein [Fervidobacterium gondwanense DSM 13020]
MSYSKGEIKAHLLKLLNEPALLITIVLISGLLIVFILLPLYKIFQISLINDDGKFTLNVYKSVLENNYFRRGFTNSILVATLTAIFGTLVGYLFAYTINRTDIPFKSFFRTIAIMPIIFPPFVGALSLIMLFGANGLITSRLLGMTNVYIYGLPGLMVAQVLCFFPVAFITLDGVLSTISPTLEDAAFNLGANRWQVFYKVILPLSAPGIASTMLVLFIESLADFGNPLILAGSKFPILSVQAYLQITGMYDLKGGAALSVWLLLPSLLAFILQKYFVDKKKYYTVTGKPTISVLKSVSEPVKWILFGICSFIVLFILLVYGVIFWGAFTKAWGANNEFTLENFKYVFDVGLNSIKGTLTIAAISTPISAILGMVIAFLVVRKVFPGKRVMEFISLLSFAVPGTVIGIGYILAFNSPPLLLTGTLAILVLNFVFRYMPVGIQSGVALLNQVDPSIEEAAFTLRATNRQVFTKITLPLITPAFFSALVFAFVRAMTAISAAIFLVSSRWNLVTVQILSQTESGRLSEACAFSLLLIVIIMVFIGVLKVFLKNKVSISNYSSVRS